MRFVFGIAAWVALVTVCQAGAQVTQGGTGIAGFVNSQPFVVPSIGQYGFVVSDSAPGRARFGAATGAPAAQDVSCPANFAATLRICPGSTGCTSNADFCTDGTLHRPLACPMPISRGSLYREAAVYNTAVGRDKCLPYATYKFGTVALLSGNVDASPPNLPAGISGATPGASFYSYRVGSAEVISGIFTRLVCSVTNEVGPLNGESAGGEGGRSLLRVGRNQALDAAKSFVTQAVLSHV